MQQRSHQLNAVAPRLGWVRRALAACLLCGMAGSTLAAPLQAQWSFRLLPGDAQLQAHPKAAFTFMAAKGQHTVRINGTVHFVTDAAEKAKLWEKIDTIVQNMYQSAENPVFEILYLDDCTCKLAKGFNPVELVE